jgi:hypothetical protein
MSKISLELSTTIKPAVPFTLDGVQYQMLTLDHLSETDEATVMALISRHQAAGVELELAPNKKQAEVAALKLRPLRLMLIGKLTTLPPEVAKTLPVSEQARLVEAIHEQMSGRPGDEGDEEEIEVPAVSAPAASDDDGDDL